MGLDSFGAIGAYALAQSMPVHERLPAAPLIATRDVPPLPSDAKPMVADSADRLAPLREDVSFVRRELNAFKDFAAAHLTPGDLGAHAGLLTAALGATSGVCSLFPQTHDLAYGLASMASMTAMSSAVGDYAQHQIDTKKREEAAASSPDGEAHKLPNEHLALASVSSGVIEGVLGTAAGIAEITSSNPHLGLYLAMGAGVTALADGVLDVVDHVHNHGGFHHFPHSGTEALDALATCASGVANAVESMLYTIPGGLLIGGTADLVQYGIHALDRFAHREPGEPLFGKPSEPTKLPPPSEPSIMA